MVNKIDRRKNYILILDTETANTVTTERGLDMSDVLVYDVGFAVIDKYGAVYEAYSYINSDIFCDEFSLMQSAYYAEKIPQYIKAIAAGTSILASQWEIRQAMLAVIDKYHIKHVCAHNARFDANALNRTQAYVTKSKYRYWFPFNSIEWWDSMNMARSVIAKMPTYKRFCAENGYLTKRGAVRVTAEILYRFISKDNSFTENHTGLQDVMIEKEIVAYCYRQKKTMRKELYKEPKEFPEMTDFQKSLAASMKSNPTIPMA